MNRFLHSLACLLLFLPVVLFGQNSDKDGNARRLSGIRKVVAGEKTTVTTNSKFIPGQPFSFKLNVAWHSYDLGALELTFPEGTVVENTTDIVSPTYGDKLAPVVSGHIVEWAQTDIWGITAYDSPMDVVFTVTLPANLTGNQQVTGRAGLSSGYGSPLEYENFTLTLKEIGNNPLLEMTRLSWYSPITMANSDLSTGDTFRASNGGLNNLVISDITGLTSPYSLTSELPITITSLASKTIDIAVATNKAGVFKNEVVVKSNGGEATLQLQSAIIDDSYVIEEFDKGATQWPPTGWSITDLGSGDKFRWNASGNCYLDADNIVGDSYAIDSSAIITPLLDLSAESGKIIGLRGSIQKWESSSIAQLTFEYKTDGGWIQVGETAEAFFNSDGDLYFSLDGIGVDKATIRIKAVAQGSKITIGTVIMPALYNPNKAPEPVVSLYPKQNAVNQSTAMDFAWDRTLFADGYKFCIGTDPDALTETDMGNVNRASHNLLGETTYYWKIIPYNIHGDAANCPVWKFTTKQFIPTEWTSMAEVNTQISFNKNEKTQPIINVREDGSSMATWFAMEEGQYKLRMQSFNAAGNERLRRNGILISGHRQKTWLTNYDAEMDADGNLLVTINDIRHADTNDQYPNTSLTIYKMSPDGEFLWGKDGITLTTNTENDYLSSHIHQNSAGQIYVGTQENDPFADEYPRIVYRLNKNGEKDLDQAFVAPGELMTFDIIKNDQIAITYQKNQMLYLEIYDKDFNKITANPILVSDDPRFPQGVGAGVNGVLHQDKKGGFYVIWQGGDGMNPTILWQYVDTSFNMANSSSGKMVSTNRVRGHAYAKSVYSPELDKVCLIWDEIMSYYNGIYGQLLNSDGSIDFAEAGKEIMPIGSNILGSDRIINHGNAFVLLYADKDPDSDITSIDNYNNALFLNQQLEPNTEIPNSNIRYSSLLNKKPMASLSHSNEMMVMIWGERRDADMDPDDNNYSSNQLYMQNLYFNGEMGNTANDVTPPMVKSVTAEGNEILMVNFTETITKESAEKHESYQLEGPGEGSITKAELVKPYQVRLSVKGLITGQQKLTASKIADIKGNISENSFAYFDFTAVEEPAAVKTVKAVDKNKVVIRFTSPVLISSVEEVTNYAIGGLAIQSVKVISDKQVVLNTANMQNQTYQLTIKQFTGVYGNSEADVTTSFTYGPNEGSLQYMTEDFNSGMPQDFTVTDVDMNQPISDLMEFASGWITIEYLQNNLGAASTSAYSPEGRADDWMTTSKISIKKGAYLYWDAASISALKPEGYEIWVSTTGNTINDAEVKVFDTKEEHYMLTQRNVNLSAFGFGDEDIYISFRNNSYDKYVMVLDNLDVFTPANIDASVLSHSIPTLVNINAQVNVKVDVINKGLEPITSLSLNWQLNNGQTYSQQISGLNIGLMQQAELEHNTIVQLPNTEGVQQLKIWTTNPNGKTDEQPANDLLTVSIDVVKGLQQRLVLLEHFTNTGCGPCAEQNPDLEALLAKDGNDKKVAHITYHPNFPSADDPFYLANTQQNTDRLNYYQVTGVPNVHLAGIQKNDSPASITQEDITMEYYRPGEVSIDGGYTFGETELSVNITLKNLKEFGTKNMVAHVIVTQNYAFGTAPGSNGEKVFPHVMRQMLTGSNGTALQSNAKNGETKLALKYTLPDDLVEKDVEIVYFVQNYDSGEIVMAGKVPVATGIDDEMVYGNLKVYPNPASDRIYFNADEPIKAVELLNVNGSVIGVTSLNSMQGNMSISHLPAGVYLVKVKYENAQVVKRLIKK